MATKAKEITQIEKGIKTVKTAVKEINTKAVEVTTEVVEETVATGKQWQALLAKGLKGGTTLFGQQQDIVLTTLESLKGQYVTNNVRLRKLLSFDFDFGYNFRKAETTVEEVVETAKKKVVAKKATAKKAVKKATTATKTAKKVTAKAATKIEGIVETAKKTVVKKATTTAKKAATTTKKAIKATPITKKAVKATAKKVIATTTAPRTKVITKNAATRIKTTSPKVEAKAVEATTTKDNLKVIEGIGPKIEGLLNEAGIQTFKQLEDAKLVTLAAILDAAGSRYRMHDPATWGAQAGMAATGKMEELKKWQEDLKGGKVAK